MTADDVKKLKYAILLVLSFVIIKSVQTLHILFIKAIFTSILVALPILYLVYKYYINTTKIRSSTKRAISMLSVPIFLFIWKVLHVKSAFYETVLVLVIIFVLIETIVLAKKYKAE